MKITIGRIFETARALATEAGQELTDFINFQAQFAEITIRALRNGLTDEDNSDCEIRTIQLTHNTPLTLGASKKKAKEIRVRRVLDVTYSLSAPLAWGFNNNGQVFITALFTPAPTSAVSCEIIILY